MGYGHNLLASLLRKASVARDSGLFQMIRIVTESGLSDTVCVAAAVYEKWYQLSFQIMNNLHEFYYNEE